MAVLISCRGLYIGFVISTKHIYYIFNVQYAISGGCLVPLQVPLIHLYNVLICALTNFICSTETHHPFYDILDYTVGLCTQTKKHASSSTARINKLQFNLTSNKTKAISHNYIAKITIPTILDIESANETRAMCVSSQQKYAQSRLTNMPLVHRCIKNI